VVGLHVTVELASIIRYLDVYSRQAVLVAPRFAALIHAPLSGNRCKLLSLQYVPRDDL
jgi:hypothetical protein